MIKFKSLEFVSLSHTIPGEIKNAVYRLKISALVREIFKFENCVKYANERTDEVTHSIQNNVKYVNSAISVNLQQKPLTLGRLIVLQATHLRLFGSHGNSLFSSLPNLILLFLVILSSKNIKQGYNLDRTYLYACWIPQMKHHW